MKYKNQYCTVCEKNQLKITCGEQEQLEEFRANYPTKIIIKLSEDFQFQTLNIVQCLHTKMMLLDALSASTTTYLSCNASKSDVVLMTTHEERRCEMHDFTLSPTVCSHTTCSSSAAHFFA